MADSKGKATIGSYTGFSKTVPAVDSDGNYTLAAFKDPSVVYVDSFEETQLGDFGPETNVIKYNTSRNGRVNKRLGVTDFGTQSLELAYVPDDPMQVLLLEAAGDKQPVAVKVSLSVNVHIYYVGYVSSAKTAPGDAGAVPMLKVTVEVDSDLFYDVAPA